jgi:hypothetical protein
MSPDLLAFLFLVTSTAIVLGIAVIVRGVYALASDPSPRLPEGSQGDPSGNDAGSSPSLDLDGASAATAAVPAAATATVPAAASAVRDMREPLIMTIGGVFILCGALLALATLIRSAA